MPRKPKVLSKSGYYHIIVRGNGKQILFESDADRNFYLRRLNRCMMEDDVRLIAWCLMDNHAHFLVWDPDDNLSRVMARVNGSFAQRFNKQANHTGHVFQGRYLREPIDEEPYLLEVVRYIHNNPQRAGICLAKDYAWSSYAEYMGKQGIADTSVVLSMLGGSKQFQDFCEAVASPSIQLRLEKSPTAETLMDIARQALFPATPELIASLPREERDCGLKTLSDTGFSIRQIERITGIGKSTIWHVINQMEKDDARPSTKNGRAGGTVPHVRMPNVTTKKGATPHKDLTEGATSRIRTPVKENQTGEAAIDARVTRVREKGGVPVIRIRTNNT